MSKHHALHQWYQRDSMLSVLLPRFYENDLFADKDRDTFRTTDPELDMDDSDTLYTQALLQSDLFGCCDSATTSCLPSSSSSSSSTATDCSSSATSLERLRMLVNHIGHSVPPPTFSSSPPNVDRKGKGRAS